MIKEKDELMRACLRGEKLWGDDFVVEEIKRWYEDEREAYTSLYMTEDRVYPYHEFNVFHAFNHLKSIGRFDSVLGFGAADGTEFAPIIRRISRLTIIEPSDSYLHKTEVSGVPGQWIKPAIDGSIPFCDETFDLVTSLGALHHIPNVSHVMYEMTRVCKKNGFIVVREPVISMGDWTSPRAGLTKRERGIPKNILYDMFLQNGLFVVHQSFCDFAPFAIVRKKFGIKINRRVVLLDAILSWVFSFNYAYHRLKWYEKVAPRSAYYVLVKR